MFKGKDGDGDLLSQDVADDQMEKFIDYYDIDPSDEDNDEKREAINSSIHRLKRAIRKGQLDISIGDDGVIKVVQSLHKDKETKIEYKEVGGQAKLEMGKRKAMDYHGRMYSLLGSLSDLGMTAISKLKGIDNSIAECLGALFLLV